MRVRRRVRWRVRRRFRWRVRRRVRRIEVSVELEEICLNDGARG